MAKGRKEEGQVAVKTTLKDWLEEAKALPDDITAPQMPIPIFLDEAGATGRFVRNYWEPAPDGKRPGLAMVKAILKRECEGEIESLIGICKDLHYKVLYGSMTDSKRKELVARGEQILAELEAAIDFVLDDGIEEPADDVWRAAKQREGADETQASLAQSLIDFAGIGETLTDRLKGLEDFDMSLIAEARQVSAGITHEGPSAVGRPSSADIDMRNRMLALLGKRVSAVRRAARYVFRRQPEIARLASSTYERRRRQASRKAAGDKPAPTPGPTPV